MKHLGHIEIRDNKVIFVYYELEKPDIDWYIVNSACFNRVDDFYKQAMGEYEASKREVEIENASKSSFGYANIFLKDKNSFYPKIISVGNNQLCETKIKNNKTIIIKIL